MKKATGSKKEEEMLFKIHLNIVLLNSWKCEFIFYRNLQFVLHPALHFFQSSVFCVLCFFQAIYRESHLFLNVNFICSLPLLPAAAFHAL